MSAIDSLRDDGRAITALRTLTKAPEPLTEWQVARNSGLAGYMNFTLRSLMLQGLVERLAGRPPRYRATDAGRARAGR